MNPEDHRSSMSLQDYPCFTRKDERWFTLLMRKQSMVRDVVKYNCMARRGFEYVFGYNMDVGGDFRSDDEKEKDEYKHLIDMLENMKDRSSAYPKNDPDWMAAMTGTNLSTNEARFGDIDVGGGGCFGESIRAIVEIHKSTEGLKREFNEQVLDVLAGHPAGSRTIFNCMSNFHSSFWIHFYIEEERQYVLFGANERSPMVNAEMMARAETCGARLLIEEADIQRLADFEDAFLESHRELLDESLMIVEAATRSAIAILSAPLEPLRHSY